MRCDAPITKTSCTISSARIGRRPHAVFEAAEQARVEAIGALAMKGVAKNLAAGLEQRLTRAAWPRRGRKADVPIADVWA